MLLTKNGFLETPAIKYVFLLLIFNLRKPFLDKTATTIKPVLTLKNLFLGKVVIFRHLDSLSKRKVPLFIPTS